MLWDFFNRSDRRGAGARFRMEHSRWLTRAIASDRPCPRIPTRSVRDGGYDRLRRLEHGPERASKWWSLASARVDSL